MALVLHYHPLSSFCQKVLIALYENGTDFEPKLVDLGDPGQRAALLRLWPLGKFPVLIDTHDDRTIPETSIIIEYLDRHYAGRSALVPKDPDLARQMRLRDRFFDLYVNTPMGKIVTDRLRPQGKNDAFGVAEAKALLATAYDMIEADIGDAWAMGDQFTMADCAAAPALAYADMAVPIGHRKKTAAYLDRLFGRPSFARVWKEAEPYRAMMPR